VLWSLLLLTTHLLPSALGYNTCLGLFYLPYRKKRGRARIEADDEEATPTGEEPRKGKKKFLSKAFISSSESSDDDKQETVVLMLLCVY